MTPIRMERLESAARTVIAFNEAFNRHDIPAMMQLVFADCVYESPSPAPSGTVYQGSSALAQYFQDFFTQLPEAHLKIEEMISIGQRCITRWRLSWTQASSQANFVHGVDIFRVHEGLIAECLTYLKGQ